MSDGEQDLSPHVLVRGLSYLWSTQKNSSLGKLDFAVLEVVPRRWLPHSCLFVMGGFGTPAGYVTLMNLAVKPTGTASGLCSVQELATGREPFRFLLLASVISIRRDRSALVLAERLLSRARGSREGVWGTRSAGSEAGPVLVPGGR